jgi:polysaccharide biosynthesis protein PelG
MAGIGFVLEKLLKKGTLTSTASAFMHSTFASSGPWLITVMALSFIYYVIGSNIDYDEVDSFRIVILYSFAFTLILSAPVNILSTRILSDHIYKKDLSIAAGLLIGSLIVVFALSAPFAYLIFFVIGNFSKEMSYLAFMNFILVSSVWQTAVFLSALKQYREVSFSFLFGMLVMIFLMKKMAHAYLAMGMLISFSIGLSCIVGPIIALVLAQYPKVFKKPFYFLTRINSYWQLALGAFFGTLGIWIDKFVMWFAPEAVLTKHNLIMYPQYDSASFMAFLAILPGISLFFLSHETSFYKNYIRYYEGIKEHETLRKIEEHKERLIKTFIENAKNMMIFQGLISLVVIFLAPLFMEALNMKYVQLGMFRILVLGAMLQIFSQQLIIILAYFDAKKRVLSIQLFFCLTNCAFTLISLYLGFTFYGLGFFFSSLCTFILAAIILEKFLERLTYHSFITVNQSLIDHGRYD